MPMQSKWVRTVPELDGEGFIEIAAPLAPDWFAAVVWRDETRQTTVWRLERV